MKFLNFVFIFLSIHLTISLDLQSKHYYDPVLITGKDLPELIGAQIDKIVAFQYNELIGNVKQLNSEISR